MTAANIVLTPAQVLAPDIARLQAKLSTKVGR